MSFPGFHCIYATVDLMIGKLSRWAYSNCIRAAFWRCQFKSKIFSSTDGRKSTRLKAQEGFYTFLLTLKMGGAGHVLKNAGGLWKLADPKQQGWDNKGQPVRKRNLSPITARNWVLSKPKLSLQMDSSLETPERRTALRTHWFHPWAGNPATPY